MKTAKGNKGFPISVIKISRNADKSQWEAIFKAATVLNMVRSRMLVDATFWLILDPVWLHFGSDPSWRLFGLSFEDMNLAQILTKRPEVICGGAC